MSASVPPVAPTDPPSESRPPAASQPPAAPSGNGFGGRLNGVYKVLAAAAITLLVIAGYVYFNEKPPVAVGEITHISAYPIHRAANASGGQQGLMGVEQTFDQVIVIAQVRIHNQSQGPLFTFDMFGNLSQASGREYRSLAATTSDFDRVFVAYPQLAPMKQPPLLRDITIPAGATIDGELIFNFPITKEEWDQRRAMTITVQFTHQKDLVMQAPQ